MKSEYELKDEYELRDEIACILIDNQTSMKHIKWIFEEIIDMKKNGIFDEDYSQK